MRWLSGAGLAAAVLAAGGCANSGPTGGSGTGAGTGSSSGTASSSGTLVGLVTSGPRCPGPERVGSPCPPAPVDGAAVAALSHGDVVASTKTDSRGRFRLDLPPATYLIRATNVGGYRSTAHKTVMLTAHRSVSVTLLVDTGIR